MKSLFQLAVNLTNDKINFVIEPSSRFLGEKGEQYTMFFKDPIGNPIEIKGFKNIDKVFESWKR